MKRIVFSLCILLLVALHLNAQINRKKIILEIFTGTWAKPCVGAALTADDLVKNNKSVGIIQYHVDNGNTIDSFANGKSLRRLYFYNIIYAPTPVFDGAPDTTIGASSTSQYEKYLPFYEKALAVQSPVNLFVQPVKTGPTSYKAMIQIVKTVTPLPANSRVIAVLTQSHITFNWQTLNHLEFVCRKCMPSPEGATITFTSDTFKTECLMDIIPLWNGNISNGDFELVVFVQDFTTKVILQGETCNLKDAVTPINYVAPFAVSNSVTVQHFNNNLLLRLPSQISNTRKVTIVNLSGKLIFNCPLSQKNCLVIPTRNWAKGIYIINIIAEGLLESKKWNLY